MMSANFLIEKILDLKEEPGDDKGNFL